MLSVNGKENIEEGSADEAWFILTNLNSLDESLNAYQKAHRLRRGFLGVKTEQERFGIEEMFRDFKSGGYNLEGTKVSDKRLMTLILLVTLAYCQATLSGEIIKNKGIAKYVGRVKEKGRNQKRHSNFYLGLHAISRPIRFAVRLVRVSSILCC